jgi:hypothetical protein
LQVTLQHVEPAFGVVPMPVGRQENPHV